MRVERRPASLRVFKTRWFERFVRKERIRDAALVEVTARAAVKAGARHLLRLTEKQMDELVKNGDFVEVRYEQEISK